MYNLEEMIHAYSIEMLFFAVVVLAALAFVALKIKRPNTYTKKILFVAIAAEVLIPTIYLIISTVYLNLISVSRGPVHWHADFEIWACGQELDLQDPTGLSNKIGTPILHEHNDKRIHLEGVVLEPDDASLGRFFQVIGGELTSTSLKVPTNTGLLSFQNWMNCSQMDLGEVQVFVYKTNENQYYYQQKLVNPQEYIISPYSNVPMGDCVIVEFDSPKLRTDKLCTSYKAAEQIRKLKGERVYGY